MKPKHFAMYVVAALLLGQSAQAFYNPQAGRWLSRDPIGEKGGASLQAFVHNDAVSRVDQLGLDVAKWSWRDGEPGEHNPQAFPEGGTDVLAWDVVASVYPCLLFDGCWELDTSGKGILRYWYSSPKAQTHERRHVAAWARTWGELRDHAVSFETQYCGKKVPECLKGVIEGSMKSAYFAIAEWLAADFDCGGGDYQPGPHRDQRCADKLRLDATVVGLAMQMHREIDACFKKGPH